MKGKESLIDLNKFFKAILCGAYLGNQSFNVHGVMLPLVALWPPADDAGTAPAERTGHRDNGEDN